MNLDIVRTKRDSELIAATIYHEARGEGWRGMLAVAHVIRNRVQRNSWYGGNVFEVVTKPFQFSCHNGGFADYYDHKALMIAEMVLAGVTVDVTHNADHYHADYVMPDWSTSMKFCTKIGRHLFYRVV